MENIDFMIEGYIINNPQRIKQTLDKYIVGQEECKKNISQAIFNHIQILKGKQDFPEQHTLLVGPSGCGKTKIFEVLKEKTNIPIHIIDLLNIKTDVDILIKLYILNCYFLVKSVMKIHHNNNLLTL